MYEQFNIEEVNLMCVFDTSSRDALIADITAARHEFRSLDGSILREMADIAEGVLAKLKAMGGLEFAALGLYPEYRDYGEETAAEAAPAKDYDTKEDGKFETR